MILPLAPIYAGAARKVDIWSGTDKMTTMIARVCDCGELFVVKPSALLRGRGRYCSHACAAKAAARPDQTGRNNPNWKGGVALKGTAKDRAYRRKYPAKYEAHRLMRNATRRGELLPQPCEVCGKAKVEGHHDDYNEPLKVRWLCKRHHLDCHIRLRKAV